MKMKHYDILSFHKTDGINDTNLLVNCNVS